MLRKFFYILIIFFISSCSIFDNNRPKNFIDYRFTQVFCNYAFKDDKDFNSTQDIKINRCLKLNGIEPNSDEPFFIREREKLGLVGMPNLLGHHFCDKMKDHCYYYAKKSYKNSSYNECMAKVMEIGCKFD